MKKMIRAVALAWALAAGLVPAARATLTTFHFTWSGVPLGNGASATGTITFDPGLIDYVSGPDATAPLTDLPSPAVTGLTMTVAGASAGNGTFGLADFYAFRLSSPSPLDFTRELVGQPLPGGFTFGSLDSACTKGNGPCGDFNFFAYKDVPGGPPPDGLDFFTLATAGGEPMRLISLAPNGVPEPGTLALAGLAIALLGGLRPAGAGAGSRV